MNMVALERVILLYMYNTRHHHANDELTTSQVAKILIRQLVEGDIDCKLP